MTPRQVAEIGVARLGLPVPTGKLVTIQAIAQALADVRTADVFEAVLLDWIATRELESECLEGLSALVLAQPETEVIARARRAIGHPSIVSDYLLSLATGNPTVLPSWTGCHACPAPQLLDVDAELKALRAGRFIPLVFTHTLERLENESGRAFVRQWAFEFKLLRRRVRSDVDGQLDYFLRHERGNVGQFVACQGHLARSAYLRTLACAVDHWGMPQRFAEHYALQALPAEPLFLKLAPGPAPAWTAGLHQHPPEAAKSAEPLVRGAVQLIEAAGERRVMHLSAEVSDSALCHVELVVFAVASVQDVADPQHALSFYDHILGRITPARDGLRAFVCPQLDLRGMERMGFVPAVIPLIGVTVGYLQSDLVGRIPYVPVSTSSLPELEATPGVGGAQLTSRSVCVGEFACWYRNWQPSHPKDWPSPIACCTTLTRNVADALAADLGGRIQQVWKLVTWTRESEYAAWSSNEQIGVLTS